MKSPTSLSIVVSALIEPFLVEGIGSGLAARIQHVFYRDFRGIVDI